MAKGGNQPFSSENPHTALSKPKSPCVICKGDHYRRDYPCIPRILRNQSPHLHNPVSSTSNDHVESTPSTSENEVNGQKGRSKFPCRLCKGDHALHHCPFLDEAKRVLDNRLASLRRLPPGYKKLLPCSSLVKNMTDTPLLSAEAPIIEDKPFESTSDQSQQAKKAVDPILSSKDPPSNDTVTKENENGTVQILFINTDSKNMGSIYPFLYHRKEVCQRFIQPFIRSHL